MPPKLKAFSIASLETFFTLEYASPKFVPGGLALGGALVAAWSASNFIILSLAFFCLGNMS